MRDCFDLSKDAVRFPYTSEVASFCNLFSCDDLDLDDFFINEALLYDSEMLGKTYCWVKRSNPKHILGMITLANDSI